MRRLSPRRSTFAKAAAVLGLFAALGGVAYAASASSFIGPHGDINACVPPNGGGFKVWKPGHHCSGGWVALAFPARAQAGPAGAPGASGAVGATGATGATGPANATTVDGETVTKLSLREPTPASSSTSETLYTGAGLTILAACDSAGNASLAANGPASADSELTFSGYGNAATPYFGGQINNLGPAAAAALGPSSAGETSFSYANSSGQLVTGTIGYQKAMSFGSYVGCAFFGTVTSG
jgi:hypothetical protein